MKNHLFRKRLFSYIIDLIILSIFVTITISFFKINTTEIESKMSKLSELLLSNDINIKTYINNYAKLFYQYDKQHILINFLNLIYSIVLFIIIPYVNKCQTIGQKLTKIKLEKIDESKITIIDLFIRSLIIYFICYLMITLIIIKFIKDIPYLVIVLFLGILTFILVFISVFMILYSKDQRGIYDILTKIKVRVIE